jgi:hypothetical protein
MSIPVAALSKAQFCSRFIAGIADWNSVGDMDVLSPVFVVCCADSSLCN